MGKLTHIARALTKALPFMVDLRAARYGAKLRALLPQWRRLPKAPKTAQRVLIATTTGGHLASTTIDSMLAGALSLRGAKVDVLLCDAALPACMLCESHFYPDAQRLARGPKELCAHCHPAARDLYAAMGIETLGLSAFLTETDANRAKDIAAGITLANAALYKVDGVSIGEHALAGAIRYFANSDLSKEPQGAFVLRLYAEAAARVAIAARKLFAGNSYDAIVLHHGIYVPQGVLAEITRQSSVRVVTWNPAYRARCFLFSHDDTYHRTMMTEPESAWLDASWDDALREQTRTYLEGRRRGAGDWIGYQREESAGLTAAQIGLDSTKPIAALFTNVAWDAQIHYASNAFDTMRDWVLDTIDWFAQHPDLQLAVRIHPAEIQHALASREHMAAHIAARFPALPPNVRIIGPDEPVNSYALAELANAALIYGTKMGVELTARGLPVIVAGEAWVRNKGVALEASSRADYFALLERLPLARLSPDTEDRALRYAHHFFFRRMIPLANVEPRAGWPPYRIASFDYAALAPGADAGLDLVCDGILNAAPFVFGGAPTVAANAERVLL